MGHIKIDTKSFEKEKKVVKEDPLKKEKASAKQPFKFNTFSGVFVPSVLAIFGAVMFLILPKVLGGVGLLPMLGIILLAHSVSIATAFSLSAIATNIKVRGGGLYYLISRSLGSEFGGALGVQLFLAQTVGVSFYSIAFARGLSVVFASVNIILPEVYIAFFSCLAFGMIAWGGAKFVVKIQYFILAAIGLALVSIFLGEGTGLYVPELVATTSIPFWVAFAMFFPAVTGIDAGVGMSGDLKDPKKSLVKGTFIAIIVTMFAYIVLAMKLSYVATLSELFTNPMIIQTISIVPALVLLGILLATFSSALSYFMAAPRTLRALAQDNIFSSKIKFLGKSIGNSTEPRAALIVSIIIACLVIFTGDLDFVSQVVAIFFLNVYGWVNGAAFFEKISKNPSYRPSFNSPWIISFYGMIISYVIMYLFNPGVMIISILFQVIVFVILSKTKSSIKLESVWEGVLFQSLRRVVSRIEKTAKSKKNWRPTVVAFCANDTNRNLMFSLLDWIGSHTGIVKFYYLMSGKVEKSTKKREIIEEDMKNYIKENRLELYPRVIDSENFRQTVETILQSETIGNLPPNTAILHFDKSFDIDKLALLAVRLKKNVVILKNNSGFSDFKYIDVWWDDPDNGNLMLMLAYLISHSKAWMEKEASIRLFKAVKNQKEADEFRAKLNKLLIDSRINNVALHIVIERKKKMPQIIRENSHYADLVLLGFPHFDKRKGVSQNLTKDIEKYTEGLTTSLVVLANDKIDFRIN
jgi:solute carrier family 12 (sodium/potassium/chloride transporter), member 2